MEAFGGGGSAGGAGGGGGGVALSNDDPRSEYTYGEFPFESFDALLDLASDFLPEAEGGGGARRRTMVDLGSGCGRLVLYAALTRGVGEEGGAESEPASKWDVHGIEIGTGLHSLAVNSLERGEENGWFESFSPDGGSEGGGGDDRHPTMSFHNGNALPVEDPYYAPTDPSSADAIRALLSKTDLLFAYSTVWETDPVRPFDPDLGAMVLSKKWSGTLAASCPRGCVAVTMDRVLDPDDGWRLLDRMDVENPSVWGSTGYVSVLEK
ncbi:hypothetical protein ACHAWF_004160 [Thalassiosira exigua]